MYNFDQPVSRWGTNCEKWDYISEKYKSKDLIPMWVADMDFEVSPYILEKVQKILNQKVFGYQYLSEEYYKAIIHWMDRRHHFTVEKEWIYYIPNVVAGLSYAIEAVSNPGDEILVLTPVYGPFYDAVTKNNRILLDCPLQEEDGYYQMDLENLEKKITSRTKAVLFCNPHNPGGRVWTRQELEQLAAICVHHNLYIISDDIHADLLMKGQVHTMIASLSEEIANRTITCTSISKPFNVASFQMAYMIVKNSDIAAKLKETLNKLHLLDGHAFCEAALIGAYNYSEQWLDEMMTYVEGNMDYLVTFIQENIPVLSVKKPEGTYLAWIDCRRLPIDPDNLLEFFVNECNVVVTDGGFFGEAGKGFVRLNMACPRNIVKKALNQIRDGIVNIK